MKSTLMKLNFNGGELSPLLDGRVDYPKYTSGAKEMTNFVPTIYGPMTKRPGTRFVKDVGESALIPFEFSETQSYILAFSDGLINFFTGDGVLLNGGSPFTLTNPFTLSQSKELSFAQTGDLLYITHKEVGIYKISRVAADNFTIIQFKPVDGPFQDANTDENESLQVESVNSSTVKISPTGLATPTFFTDKDIGKTMKFEYIPSTRYDTWEPESHSFDGTEIKYALNDYIQYESRIYQVTGFTAPAVDPSRTGTRSPLHEKGSESDGNLVLTYIADSFGYAEITAITLGTPNTATATIKRPFPPNIVDGPSFTDWSWGAFGGEFGWPNAITFHQQRMVLGGSLVQTQTIWGSVTGDIQNFKEGLNDNEAYEFTVASNKRNPILWLNSNVILNIGTQGGEFFATSAGPAITPTDIAIDQIGQYGSAENVEPLIASGFTIFAQSSGRKLRELRFSEDTQRNYARDLNKVAEHIADDGIKQIAYQQEPYQIVWVIIGVKLYALTYETEEEVFAWSEQDCGNVVSIATIPDNGDERLWLCIERDGNYYTEYLTKFYRRADSIEDACFVDSSLLYEGAETSTITGLNHLEGKTVQVLNNGSVGQPQLVSSGQITLQYPTTKCVIGLPMLSAWQSMRFEGGSQDGVGQGKSKRVSNVIFRLEQTGAGVTYGRGDINSAYTGDIGLLPVRETDDFMDSAPPLLNGDTVRQPIGGGRDSQWMLRMEHSEPVPCTVISVILVVDTEQ